MRAAVLGSPVGHSLSPALHRAAYQALGLAGWTYEAIECDEARLPDVLGGCGPDWAGLSLTMPLKRAVLPLLDVTEPLAADVGAANTVIFAAGARHGHNTDVPGMITALAAAGVSGSGPVLILGAGATACSALAAVRGFGAGEVTAVVRDPARAGELLAAAGRLGMTVRLAELRPGRPGRELAPADLDGSGRGRRMPTRSRYSTGISSPPRCSMWSTTPGPPGWPPPRSRPGRS